MRKFIRGNWPNSVVLGFLALLFCGGVGLGTLAGLDLQKPANAAATCGGVRVDCTTGHVEPASKIVIPETQVTFSDVTTNNMSTSKHGFCPKGSGSATDCLLGTGAFGACPGGGTTPSGTGWVHVTSGVQDATASTPTYSQVGADQSGAAASAQAAAEAYSDGNLATHAALTTTAHGGLVPSSRTVCTHALSADVCPTATEVGADASGAAATVQTNLTSHINATGTAVHGLGSASTHAAGDFDSSGAAATVQANLDTHAALTTTAHGGIVSSTDTRLTDARAPTGNITSAGAVKLYQGTGTSSATSVALSSTPRVEVSGVTEAMQTLADNTTGNVSTSAHGYAPKAPNDADQFLNGTGAYGRSTYAVLARTLYTSGTSTHTFQTLTRKFLIEGCGAGGGGGGAAASVGGGVAVGGGGGAGGYLMKWLAIASGTASVTIGAGGTGVSNGTGNGGGTTTITYNSVTYTIYGGGGAPAGSSTTALMIVSYGAGGTTASGGDVNANGKPGLLGIVLTTTYFESGFGGTSPWGGGAGGRGSDGDGGSATGYCGGGGGAAATGASNRTGGSGAGALVIITEYS